MTRMVLEPGIGLISLTMNIFLLTILVSFKSKKLKKSTQSFLIFQASNHAMLAVMISTRSYIRADNCSFFGTGIVFISIMIMTGTLLLGLDSFLTMIYPYTHHRLLTPRLGKLLPVAVVLFWAAIFLALSLLQSSQWDFPEECKINNTYFRDDSLIGLCVASLLIMLISMFLQAWTVKILNQQKTPQLRPQNNTTTHEVMNVQAPIQTVATNVQVASLQSPNIPTQIRQGRSLQRQVTRQGRLLRLLMVPLLSAFLSWTPVLCSVIAIAVRNHLGLPIQNIYTFQKGGGILVWLNSVLYPCIVLALSSELRAACKTKICRSPHITPTNLN